MGRVTVDFKTLTLCGEDRLLLGPPLFKKLRRILIGEFVCFPQDEPTPAFNSEMHLLRGMNPDVELLRIRHLKILRGGIDILGASTVQIGTVVSSNGAGPDTEGGGIRLHDNGAGFQIDHVDTVDIDTLINTDIDDSDSLVVSKMKIKLPRYVEPTRKWAPVATTTGYRSTG